MSLKCTLITMFDRDSDTGLQRGFVKQRPNIALIASPV